MANIRIQLVETNEGYLNLAEDANIPVTFSIAEIRDITKRKGTFSKTIKLAGDKNNNQLLNNYFDVNVVDGTFNINRLQKCIILEDNIPILENAYIQLLGVKKVQATNQHDQLVEYEAVIKDSIGDFFTKLGGAELTDLTFNGYNHILNSTNVSATFNNTVDDVYKYIMPMNQSSNVYSINEWTPAIYAKQYWDRIFYAAGYEYEWNSMTGSTIQFDKLIIPYNGDTPQLTADDQTLYRVIADISTGTTFTHTNTSGNIVSFTNQLIINNEIQDNYNLYNPSTGVYTNFITSSAGDSLTVEFDIEYVVKLINTHSGTAYLHPATPSIAIGGLRYQPQLEVRKNNSGFGSTVNIKTNGTPYIQLNEDYTLSAGTTTILTGSTTVSIPIAGLQPSDTLKTYFKMDVTQKNSFEVCKFYTASVGGSLVNVNEKIEISSIKMRINPSVNSYGYNTIIDLNNFIPQKIKQSDFIKSILTMFNLYIDVDKTSSTKLIIKTRDEYYDAGTIVDWTDKLNKNLDQNLQFLPELSAKKLVLSYKDDNSDIVNKGYLENVREMYGQQDFTFDNEYIKGEERKEIIFSPTPVGLTYFNAVAPYINGAAPKNNIRILYDGGLYTSQPWKINDYYINAVGYGQTLTQYPLFSHFDAPTNPKFDINFGVCDYYLYNSIGAKTNNNLYNLHWRRTINQINENKMLIAYFDLSGADIFKMKLSDKIRIDNSYWNINKVIDYNPSKLGPTKVELISIDDELKLAPFKTKKPTLPSKGDTVLSAVNIKERDRFISNNTIAGLADVVGTNNVVGTDVFGGIIRGDRNEVYTTSAQIIGNDNLIGADAFIIGDANTISADAFIIGDANIIESKAFIVGNENTVVSGITDTILFGNGITATTGNTLYTNNIQITSGGTLNGQTIENIVTGSNLWTTGSTGNYSVKAVNDTGIDATGNYAVAEGNNTIASGVASHAEGAISIAAGNYSHVEGLQNEANGTASHAEGFQAIANGVGSHAEGSSTLAIGSISHAEGELTIAIGDISHAEGYNTKTGWKGFPVTSVVSGVVTISGLGDLSSLFPIGSKVIIGDASNPIQSTVLGSSYSAPDVIVTINNTTITYADYISAGDDIFNSDPNAVIVPDSGKWSHAEGAYSQAIGIGSHAEGNLTIANGTASHAEGDSSIANGYASHAEGGSSIANGDYSHAEGLQNVASGPQSHAEGNQNVASGNASHAEGVYTQATAEGSHAEGAETTASGDYSHAEGQSCLASGSRSHAEGYETQATSEASHSEGKLTIASGTYSHAQGWNTRASGSTSHAGGYNTKANGNYSFVHGENSEANGINTIVFGKNITGTTSDTTYVDQLNIKTIGSGAPIINLGLDSNGFVVTGTTSSGGIFTGGTVTGATNFTNGLTANTISATTYLNLPTDIRVTGGTYDNSIGTATFTNNTGGTFTVSGFFTGGTLNGLTNLNGLTGASQSFATSTTGTDFTISSAGSTHTFNLPIADATNTGKLSSIDWVAFNNKVATTRTIATTAPLQGGGDLSGNRTLSITQATTSTNGYLSSTDWNTFNNKQAGDATLTALAAYNTNGILTQTATDTFVGRTITGGSCISVTFGNGVFGNPTIALTGGTMTGALTVTGDLMTNGNLTADDFEQVSHATTQTINATPITIKTIAIANECIYQIEANVLGGINDTTKGITSKIVASFKNNGGVVTQIGSQNIIMNSDFTGTADVTMSISGTNIIIQVIGEAATTIDWGSSIITHKMGMGLI